MGIVGWLGRGVADQEKRYVRDPFGYFLLYREPAPREDRPHPRVLRQYLCVKLRDSFLPADLRKMPEGKSRDAESLVILLDREGHFRPVRRIRVADRHVTPCPDDLFS